MTESNFNSAVSLVRRLLLDFLALHRSEGHIYPFLGGVERGGVESQLALR